MNERALLTFEEFGQAIDRIVHALRSPLGVALGVLDDASRGVACEPRDFADGAQALGVIKRQLEQVASIFPSDDATPVETSLGEIAAATLRAIGKNLPIEGKGGVPQMLSAPHLTKILSGLLEFLDAAGGLKRLSVTSRDGARESLSIELERGEQLPVGPLEQVVKADRSLGALSVLAAARYCQSQGGNAAVERTPGTVVVLWL